MSDQGAEGTSESIVKNKCYYCDAEAVGKCIQCGHEFCNLDTSRLDPRYCMECNSEILIQEDTYTRTTREYDEVTDKFFEETRRCKEIKFEGIDWMLQARRLSSMTDAEAKTELEYHRALVIFLESDLSARSVKRSKMKIQQDIDNKHARRVKVQSITETKTRKISTKVAKEVDPMAFAKQLLAMGLGDLFKGK